MRSSAMRRPMCAWLPPTGLIPRRRTTSATLWEWATSSRRRDSGGDQGEGLFLGGDRGWGALQGLLGGFLHEGDGEGADQGGAHRVVGGDHDVLVEGVHEGGDDQGSGAAEEGDREVVADGEG